MDIPAEKNALRDALIEQREYTLDVYRDLPADYWIPSRFPYSALMNPPLWELAHIAWFAEFFCCRWRPDDVDGKRSPSVWADADRFLNSSRVPHRDRWVLPYPSHSEMMRYMNDSLERVLTALALVAPDRISLFQLALLHEAMHGEALLMTLSGLGLKHFDPPRRRNDGNVVLPNVVLRLDGGTLALGSSGRAFQFDNELPVTPVLVEPFDIDAEVVSQAEFMAWKQGVRPQGTSEANAVAMHVTYAEAEAYAMSLGRRLPTEAEWEFAATHSPEFWRSTGMVWEWTASVFAPRPGFVAGPYQDYSEPSFPGHAGAGAHCQVLKGGSFATHARLKYPQYRNFYAPTRNDMFCGFRTVGVSSNRSTIK